MTEFFAGQFQECRRIGRIRQSLMDIGAEKTIAGQSKKVCIQRYSANGVSAAADQHRIVGNRDPEVGGKGDEFFCPSGMKTICKDNCFPGIQRAFLTRRPKGGIGTSLRFVCAEITVLSGIGAAFKTGENLHIGKLSLDGGELHVSGRIDSVAYEDDVQPQGGLFARLFG